MGVVLMLRIRLDINGAPIGTLGVWNSEERRIDEETETIEIRYQVHDLRGYDMWGGSIEDWPHLTDVWHDQEGDAATLTAAVMGAVGDEPLIDYRSSAEGD